jgi:DNA modification methylase
LELSFLDDEQEDNNNDDSGSGEDDYEQPEKIISRVKLGEIWQLGRHKIACGDSTIESNVKALLGDNLAVLVHADPPYGMGKEKDGVMNDNLYGDKLDNFQMAWIKACRKNVEDNGSFYIWGNAEDLWRLWYSGGLKKSERLTFRNQIIWDKKHGQGMLSDDFRMYPTVTEHCLFYMVGEQGFNNNADNYFKGWDSIVDYLNTEKNKAKLTIKDCKRLAGHSEKSGCHWFDKSQWMIPTEETYNSWRGYCRQNNIDAFKKEYDELKKEYYATRAYFNNTHENMTDVWEYPRVQGEERWGHATPKPVDMIARIYKSSSPDDAVIYSPFLGSGTDVIAAQQIEGDRTVYGFELSPEYCEIICQRFEKFTGIEAKLIGTLSTKLKDDTQSEEYLNSLGF